MEPDCHLQKYPSGTGELQTRNHLHMSRLQVSRTPKEKSDFTLMEYAFFLFERQVLRFQLSESSSERISGFWCKQGKVCCLPEVLYAN